MTLSALIRPAAALLLLLAFALNGAFAKGRDRTPRTCAQMQMMMDHGLTGGKHAGDRAGKRAKLEKKMRKNGCLA